MSSSSNVQQAREALGLRLREIRKDAGLTSRELARRAGWHESKCSRLEHGRTSPSDQDIRSWASVCGVQDQVADLIAAARGIESMYVDWRRMERGGLKQVQRSVASLMDRTSRFRMYQSWVVPGLLQTAGYTRAVLGTVSALRNVPGDIEDAVAVRVQRQRALHCGRQTFAMLLEEWVLRTVIGNSEVMANQLGHLIAAGTLPCVSLGIVPLGVPRGLGWPVESFTLYDDAQANVELVAGHLTVTRPSEVAEYARAFTELSEIAVYGPRARKLITAAIDSLK
ncbi:helix-turn-helix domain-containing protein [Streptomyces niveus]|uniref:helix-turn-helix domain-containing protein n=1 Tax=Streptomyces niveus TaxID=193462 RepID=UPI0033ED7FE3